MEVLVDLDSATEVDELPSQEDFQTWSTAALKHLQGLECNVNQQEAKFELSIRLIDEPESASLNENYRHKNGPTNILSFPFDGIQNDPLQFLGDLAICAPIVNQEAKQQLKTQQAHWAHLTVHGVLHLNAYDHESSQEANIMENLEINILNTLGFNNPYLYTTSS